jgi:hypothetical protein
VGTSVQEVERIPLRGKPFVVMSKVNFTVDMR